MHPLGTFRESKTCAYASSEIPLAAIFRCSLRKRISERLQRGAGSAIVSSLKAFVLSLKFGIVLGRGVPIGSKGTPATCGRAVVRGN